MKTPTEAQVSFAAAISNTLGIEFPLCAKQYTRKAFHNFITDNIIKFNQVKQGGSFLFVDNWEAEDLCYCGLYENDAWTEHY